MLLRPSKRAARRSTVGLVAFALALSQASAQPLAGGGAGAGSVSDAGDVPPETMPAPPAPINVMVPIRFRVATDERGELVRDKEWLLAQVERANQVFAPAGVSFCAIGALALSRRELHTREDRSRLGRHLERGVINVFVVGAMRDVDDPTQWRRGVHWRLPWRRERHFVVVTAIAPPITLAHELGHFFGNPKHRWVSGNVMSYDAGESPRFDPDQLIRVVAHARRFLRRRELVTVARFGELTDIGELPRRWDDVEPPETSAAP